MARTDELKERIRQQPLNDRLEESRRRIGDMCSKGRCPKMTIPVQHDDDDFYINTTLADAQATIATLQARVKELEEITKVICGHCCEPMSVQSRADLQTSLTQLQGLVRALFEFKCEDRPEQFSTENPMYEEGDEACPFFTEAYLYVLLGKEDARSLLNITKQLRETLPRTLPTTPKERHE